MRSGSVSSCFTNFDDKHDDIIWSLILFSISFPYSQYGPNCRNWLMHCSIGSFSSCLAARNIDLSKGIFFWCRSVVLVLLVIFCIVLSHVLSHLVGHICPVFLGQPFVVIKHFGDHHHLLVMLEWNTEIVFFHFVHSDWLILVAMWVKRRYWRYL